jgi:hypothetical protein
MQYIHEDANATLSAGCKTFMTRLLIHQRTVHSLIHNWFLLRNWQPGITPLVERSHVTTRICCILGQKDGLNGWKGLILQPVSIAYWVKKMGSRVMTGKLLDGFNCEFKCEHNRRKKLKGALLGSQHFGVEGCVEL